MNTVGRSLKMLLNVNTFSSTWKSSWGRPSRRTPPCDHEPHNLIRSHLCTINKWLSGAHIYSDSCEKLSQISPSTVFHYVTISSYIKAALVTTCEYACRLPPNILDDPARLVNAMNAPKLNSLTPKLFSYFTSYFIIFGARGSVVGWGTMLQAGRSQIRFSISSPDFSIDLILAAALWPGVDSATNRNEYQESSWE
jgi:hypothetical protein